MKGIAKVNLDKVANLNELITRSSYYWMIVSEIKFIAHNVMPNEMSPIFFADFLINLPDEYAKKVSLLVAHE